MLTKLEMRLLYLLQKHGGRARLMELSQQTHRKKPKDRDRSLGYLENLGLISSASVPPKGGGRGRPGLVYWLTETGKEYVKGAIKSGHMKDPENEPRRKVCQ